MEQNLRLSFDVEGQVKKALRLIEMYKSEGIAKEKILIKLSSTWEGVRAAEYVNKTKFSRTLLSKINLIQPNCVKNFGTGSRNSC